MYSRGNDDTRDRGAHLKEMYAVDVSPTLISTVTEAVMEEVKRHGRIGRWRKPTPFCIWTRYG